MRNLRNNAARTSWAAHASCIAPLKSRALILLVLIAAAPSFPYWCASAADAEAGANPGASADPPNRSEEQQVQLEKLKADLQKTRTEIDKAKAEIENLREIGPGLYRITTIATSLGGLAGAIVGAAFAFWAARIGHQINQNYTKAQSDKLLQDREAEHEKHNLELYKSLGSENARGQFAAAAVLLQRLERLVKLPTGDPDATTIIHVLISVLKERENQQEGDVLRKHIADNMVKALGLVSWDGHLKESRAASILANFDLQRSNLRDVFWRGVNIRGVDLYGSDLSTASLRNADLRKAVLYEANLTDCIFVGANLGEANLEKATLIGANFSGANLAEVRLIGAKFDARTKWPVGFSAVEAGAVDVTSAAVLPQEAAFPY